jgi:hypothetical protein
MPFIPVDLLEKQTISAKPAILDGDDIRPVIRQDHGTIRPGQQA